MDFIADWGTLDKQIVGVWLQLGMSTWRKENVGINKALKGRTISWCARSKGGAFKKEEKRQQTMLPDDTLGTICDKPQMAYLAFILEGFRAIKWLD